MDLRWIFDNLRHVSLFAILGIVWKLTLIAIRIQKRLVTAEEKLLELARLAPELKCELEETKMAVKDGFDKLHWQMDKSNDALNQLTVILAAKNTAYTK